MKAYKIKISINNIEPAVWRQAIIPADISFLRLSAIFNDMIGWMGGNTLFTLMSPDGYSISGMPDGSEMDLANSSLIPGLEGRGETISSLFDDNKELLYLYDLRQPWEHRVEIEECISDVEEDYPYILDGEGICPPEEWGGPERYMEIMYNPDESERELRDLYLEELDSFDAVSVNEYLKFLYSSESMPAGEELTNVGVSFEPEEELPDLRHSLQNYRLEDLQGICRELNAIGFDELNHNEIVDFTANLLTDTKVMAEALCDMQDEQMEFFRSICEEPCHFLDLEESARAQADEFLCRGYMYQTVAGVYFVPNEIIGCYDNIDRDAFQTGRERIRRIIDYCFATVHLYGITEINQVVNVFNLQTEKPLKEERLMEVLAFEMRHGNCRVKWAGNYLYMGELNSEEFEWILSRQGDKPYYIPQEEELLKYADFYYCEETQTWQRLKHFFKNEMSLESFEGELLCHQLQELIHKGTAFEEVLKVPELFGVSPMDEAQKAHFSEYLWHARSTTRLAEHRGFTPNEMDGIDGE